MAELRDVWSKVQIVSGIITASATLALTFILWSAGEKVKSAERVTSLLQHLGGAQPSQRQLALSVIDELVRTHNLPAELSRSLLVIVASDSDTTVREMAIRIGSRIAGFNQSVRTEIIPNLQKINNAEPSNVEGIKARDTLQQISEFASQKPNQGASDTMVLRSRVYFHIRQEQDRMMASAAAKALKDSLPDVIVPGIQLLTTGPRTTELRYFRNDPEEKAQAQRIAETLKNSGMELKLVDLSALFANSTAIRQRHYELWIAPKV